MPYEIESPLGAGGMGAGHMVLTLGAGSVSQLGAMLLEKLGTERPSQS